MPKAIEAVYENGILKPLKTLKLKEHQMVKITVIPTKVKEVPPIVKKIIGHLSGSLPVRSAQDIISDTCLDAD